MPAFSRTARAIRPQRTRPAARPDRTTTPYDRCTTTLHDQTQGELVMPTAARPADNDVVLEALVQRAANEGQMSLAQLRTTFDEAGIGPEQARAVLRRLTEGGLVIGSEGDVTEPRKPRRAASTRPAPARKAATRPAGRTTPATTSE